VRVDRSGTEWRQVGDEIVVLNVRTARYLALNRSATVLWPSLVEGAEVPTLVARLRDEYGVGEADAKRDVMSFVDSLRQLEVLERSEPSP
jgi:hypothetical protein